MRKIFSCVYLCCSDFVDTLSNETSSEVQEGLDDILTRMKGRVFAQIHTFLLKLLRKLANRRNLYLGLATGARLSFFSLDKSLPFKKSFLDLNFSEVIFYADSFGAYNDSEL